MQKKRAENSLSCSAKGRAKSFRGSVSPEGMIFGSMPDVQKDAGVPCFFRNGTFQVDGQPGEDLGMNGEFSGKDRFAFDSDSTSFQGALSHSVEHGSGFGRLRSSISRRSRCMVLPVAPQDCLIPQLYGNGFEIKDFVYTPEPPPSLTFSRSLYVTDGSQIISRSGCEQLASCYANKLGRKSNSVCLQNNKMDLCAVCKSSKGTSSELLHFSMIISIGAILAMATRKREEERLKDMLKQRESLIQDLQEELELKDSLTVEELVNNCIGQPLTLDKSDLHLHSGDHEVNEIHPSFVDKTVEQPESFSKIEAELQAELEKLGLDMNKSNLEGKMTILDELDDEAAVVIQGELCKEKLSLREEEEDESRCNSRGSAPIFTPPVNYSVSPTELSVKLHEVIKSRLEERIKELEAALAHVQRAFYFVGSEKLDSLNASDTGSSSNHESPLVAEPAAAAAERPFCINLSGDALDAYHEAYDEFVMTNEAEVKPPSPALTSSKISGDDLFDPDGGTVWQTDGYELGSLAIDENPYEKPPSRCATEWKSEVTIKGADGARDDNNEEEELYDDEEERNLIQQIVEMTRKGSPFVQQILLSMD